MDSCIGPTPHGQKADTHVNGPDVAAESPACVRDHAVALTRRGFRVFRIHKGTKNHFIDTDWATSATGDPKSAYDMFTEPKTSRSRDCNIGVVASDLVIIDVDTASGGHTDGRAAWASLGIVVPTFAVRTPSGGLHYYFAGAGKLYGQRALAPGVDVRSGNGYVLGPGSTNAAGGTYEVVNNSRPATIPAVLAERLTRAVERIAGAPLVIGELDGAQNIKRAAAFLDTHPPAVQGDGGDAHTYTTCCRVGDFGLSVDAAFEVMREWDAGCSPPWGDELRVKIENATNHRKSPVGSMNGVGDFDDMTAMLVDVQRAQELDGAARCLNLAHSDFAKIPLRRWIVQGFLERGKSTCLVAPGATGKSLYCLSCAVSIVSDTAKIHENLGFHARDGANVLIVNAEDDLDEQKRRLAALSMHHGVSLDLLPHRLTVIDVSMLGAEGPRLVSRDGRLKTTNFFDQLAKFIVRGKFGAVFLDPLRALHDCDENSNTDMAFVIRAVNRLAQITGAAICVLHHPRKARPGDQDGIAGDADAASGAGSIISTFRLVKTLAKMDTSEAKRLGIKAGDRAKYIRLDNAKANHDADGLPPIWYEKKGVTIPNSERSVTLAPVVFEHEKADRDRRGKIIDLLRRGSAPGVGLATAVRGNFGAGKVICRELDLTTGIVQVDLQWLEAQKIIQRRKVGKDSERWWVDEDQAVWEVGSPAK